ncbi:DUF4176 domain-containing protein [Neobacillus mesonae]|nr:DUF4176 domain-containing protein [Neobacillus mesonae]
MNEQNHMVQQKEKQTQSAERTLYPIGSVVRFKEWEQTLMIYGRMQVDSDTLAIWDYVACYYPHGNISKDSNVFFNHEDISELVYKGYENEQELEFRQMLLEQIPSDKNETKA